jgi:acyl-CoA synthetase (AMP-forming)/AMP-acid ligase II
MFQFLFEILIKDHSFSGEKISPIEVDAVLLAHADVAQAVAFGVPDPKYGEEVLYLA